VSASVWPASRDWLIFLVLAGCFGCMWLIDWDLSTDEAKLGPGVGEVHHDGAN
jgi:hypothetical protein